MCVLRICAQCTIRTQILHTDLYVPITRILIAGYKTKNGWISVCEMCGLDCASCRVKNRLVERCVIYVVFRVLQFTDSKEQQYSGISTIVIIV